MKCTLFIYRVSFIAMCLISSLAAIQAAETKGEQTVVIEALIDGPSELRVKKDGIYWINGENAKPGRHEGQEKSTYVNGKSWKPNWKEPRNDRGIDRSATKNVEGIDPTKIEFKLVMVALTRDGTGIEQRDAVRNALLSKEFSIIIPDGQTGPRWYRFELIQHP